MGLNYINDRLRKALSLVEHCRCMADVGSDHGYASIFALESGLAEKVIATDISRPSLDKTEKLIASRNMAEKSSCRCGDGFEVLKPAEADVAFVCGMGADLIADIVENSPDVSEQFDYMILQPMNSAEPLRRRLTQNGYVILCERVVFENGKWYSVLKVKKGEPEKLSETQLIFGTFIGREKIEDCVEYLEHMEGHYNKIIGYVGENATQLALDGINEAKARIELIREALVWAKS